MALEIKLNNEFFKEDVLFTDYNLPKLEIALTDLECFTIADLLQKVALISSGDSKLSEEETKKGFEEVEDITKIIWKDKYDFYFEKLPNKIFEYYTSVIITEITCKVKEQEQIRGNNIVKKYKLQQVKK